MNDFGLNVASLDVLTQRYKQEKEVQVTNMTQLVKINKANEKIKLYMSLDFVCYLQS